LLEDFCTDGGDGRAGALELFTALLFHDIDKDIEKSVQIMMESFGATEKSLSVGQSWLADAAKYIRATNYSLEICDTTGGAIVADIDLSILGQEPWLYDVYAKNIREEYKKDIPYFVFAKKRVEVLESLKKRHGGRIYFTNFCEERFSRIAISNLSREIDELRKVGK